MNTIKSLMGQVKADLAAPQAHAKELLIAMAIGLLFLIIIYLVIKIIFQKQHRAAAPADLFTPSDVPKKTRYPQILIILAILLALAIIFGFHQTSQPSFCANCHEMKPYYSSWQKSRHSDVGCLVCHQQQGAFGYLIGKTQILRDISLNRIYFARSAPIIADPINNENCVSCHYKIPNVLRNGVKISHKFIKFSCSSCHKTVGHSFTTRPKLRTMDQCLTCHNGVRAPNRCNLCHIKDLGYKQNQLDNYSNADLSDKDCDTCHSNIDCKSCHKGSQ